MKHQKIKQFSVDSCIVQTFDSVFSIALFWRLGFWGVILLLLLHLLFVSAKLFYREPVLYVLHLLYRDSVHKGCAPIPSCYAIDILLCWVRIELIHALLSFLSVLWSPCDSEKRVLQSVSIFCHSQWCVLWCMRPINQTIKPHEKA